MLFYLLGITVKVQALCGDGQLRNLTFETTMDREIKDFLLESPVTFPPHACQKEVSFLAGTAISYRAQLIRLKISPPTTAHVGVENKGEGGGGK